EDGIRDFHVTGVQTCALPIYDENSGEDQNTPGEGTDDENQEGEDNGEGKDEGDTDDGDNSDPNDSSDDQEPEYDGKTFVRFKARSEERRVGKECRCRWARYIV